MDYELKKILGLAIETPLEYWQFYWRRLVGKLKDNDFDLFPLESPHFLIDMILSEINYQGLKNKTNCKLFQERLNYFLKKDIALKNLFEDKVKLIINNILDNSKTQYVSFICTVIQKGFQQGDYFKELIACTSKVIKQTTSLDKESRAKINFCTFQIIAEFISKGYNPEDIETLCKSYPGVFQQEFRNVIMAPDTIFDISINDFPNKEAYYSKIEEIISNLNIDEWLKVISDAFFMPTTPAYFLTRLNGIKGVAEFSINDITIYNPSKRQYINESNRQDCTIEQVTPGRDYLNVALSINYKEHFLHTTKEQAYTKITNLIDLINIHYPKYNISFDKDNYVIVKNGKPCAGNIFDSHKQPDESIKFYSAKDISSSDKDFQLISQQFKIVHSRNFLSDKRLTNAIRWINKSITSSSHEDKLLYSWIALESILNIDSSLKENICKGTYTSLDYIIRVVKAITFNSYYKRPLYRYYDNLLMSVNSNNNYFGLSKQLIDDAALNLKVNEKYQLRKFFNHIPQIIENINDIVLKNDIEQIYDFYTVNGYDNYEKRLAMNITLIYRFRNLIAHNATFSQYIIKYYAEDIEVITLRVVRNFIDTCRVYDISIEDAILKNIIRYDIFKSNIKKHIHDFIVDY